MLIIIIRRILIIFKLRNEGKMEHSPAFFLLQEASSSTVIHVLIWLVASVCVLLNILLLVWQQCHGQLKNSSGTPAIYHLYTGVDWLDTASPNRGVAYILAGRWPCILLQTPVYYEGWSHVHPVFQDNLFLGIYWHCCSKVWVLGELNEAHRLQNGREI